MNRGQAALWTAVVIGLFIIACVWKFGGYNDSHHWQVLQKINGDVAIIDGSGMYWKGWGSVWTYPRVMEAYYSKHKNEGGHDDQSIKTTFNDGGNADVSTFVKWKLPSDATNRLKLHQDFNANPDTICDAVRSHLTNCVKVTGPVMSASENQSSRKAEFNQITEEQLKRGLFEMHRTEVELKDVVEEKVENGQKITKNARVQATEVVVAKDGKPVVIEPSPLIQYGIDVIQFSVTDIEYDPQTLAQFTAKKEAYLNAEKSKAQTQEEVQKRLMIEEMGRRQVAEIAAEENQKKERATIQAQQSADVAVINKTQAVTAAQQLTEVAEQQRLEAMKRRDISLIKAETAELDKRAKISLAEATQKSIELGGGLSEKERTLAEIKRDRDIGVATAFSKVVGPHVMITGGQNGTGNMTENLMQLKLMQAAGLLDGK